MSKGVLLMAHGAPESLDDMREYYIEVMGGQIPSDEMVENLKSRYESIGGESPLLDITLRKAEALEEQLGDEYQVYAGMRFWHPYIKEAIEEMAEDGITHAVAIVMQPHYSYMTVGRYFQALDEANEELGHPIKFHKITSWKTHPKYIDALVERLEKSFADPSFADFEREDITVLFTAYNLPERILQHDDAYPDELAATYTALSSRTGLENWDFAYQSSNYPHEPVLGPTLEQKVSELSEKDNNKIIICPVSLIDEHTEILYDIDIEARKEAEKQGIFMKRIQMLNDHPSLIEGFTDMVKKASIWKQMSS